eukprot:CAMPEP_0118923010 /NCGR_PEP_ID=MMETSP1169-20130426/1706_1 /TAXON_ID=36882 /ORGANISM="Pyramimonas obovata, Strain CCMP722" /LENGTH=282 /DNA_ID=CAMNT_0006863943 /DNA_START=263 /DNA_END=1108 /DNA_ORIENTATION=-
MSSSVVSQHIRLVSARGHGAPRRASQFGQKCRLSKPIKAKSLNRFVPRVFGAATSTPGSTASNGKGDDPSEAEGRERWDAVCYDDPLCGGVLQKVPHINEWISDLPVYHNEIQEEEAHFVDPDDVVLRNVILNINKPLNGDLYLRAGPRQEIVFHKDEVVAAVVTCGGLCPGLNTVIREVVASLERNYGVTQIYGVKNGYRGFYSENMVELSMKLCEDIQHHGGTMLGTSRGGADIGKIVDSIEARGINQVYVIGGDGTQRGANAIYELCRARGLKVAVAGI